MSNRHDPEGLRLPVKIDSTSNGEFEPVPLSETNIAGNQLALEAGSANARRTGLDRRQFLMSACGAASTLLAHNRANAAAGKTQGRFDLPEEAALDPQVALDVLGGSEFIFDVQGHYVDPNGRWLRDNPEKGKRFLWTPKSQCSPSEQAGLNAHLACLDKSEFIKDVFLDSDTDMMVLSFVPSAREEEPLTIEDAAATREIVSELEGNKRLMIHGRVNPNQDGDLEGMDELHERWNICAWKTYTQFGPGGKGFFLSDEDTGIPFIEKARALGTKIICVHKGLPFGPHSYEHSQCSDIGKVAKRFPDVDFLIYHSGYVAGHPERAFEGKGSHDGIDTLIRSLIENDIAPNSNVYAELGSSWRHLMREPDDAAHALGKLFKYCGEDNVLWGTDSIWYGSPQDQIQAFRSFQISAEYQDRYGYPEITPTLRAKVFGLNAMRPYKIDLEEVRRLALADKLSRQKENYRNAPDPSFATHGPRTRREFLNLKQWENGEPG